MRKLIGCSTLAIVICLSAAKANAENLNPNVSSWSPCAPMGYRGATPDLIRTALTEGRAAYTFRNPERYTLPNPEGPLNDYYRDSGLSDRLGDSQGRAATPNVGPDSDLDPHAPHKDSGLRNYYPEDRFFLNDD
jgi:hypothetical protein